MVENQGVVTSFFLPGFPLLLALGGIVATPFAVTPVLGAASGLALYYALEAELGGAIALGAAAAWLFSPLVIWGSTVVMSDLPAAAFSIFSVLALRRKRPLVAGALWGFSLSIRPTQALLGPALLLLAGPTWRSRRRLLWLALGAAAAVIGMWIFLRLSRGNIPVAYRSNVRILGGERVSEQVAFILRTTLMLHVPICALAVVGIVARPRAALPYLAWYVSFAALHSFWNWRLDGWWLLRFMLPALPAVFVLAAQGAGAIASVLTERGPPLAATLGKILGGVTVAGYAAWTLFVSPAAREDLTTTFDVRYPIAVRSVARAIPAGSLVGALTLSGPLRLYASFQSFYWCHEDTAGLLRWAMAAGRPVYTVLDGGEMACNPEAARLAAEWGYDLNVLATDLPTGWTLRRLGPP
jgi:hypothetical protein